jgi:hypothetical protein
MAKLFLLCVAARADVIASWIRSAAAALDRTVPVTIATMQERMHAVSERPRFTTVLLSLFALIGVVLAAGGLYGLLSSWCYSGNGKWESGWRLAPRPDKSSG